MFTLLLTIVVVLVLAYMLVAYNSLVRQRNQASEAFSDIDVQLKRRHNLIPNLVETVKGYAAHESSTLESVTKARADALSAQTPAEQAHAENALSSTLKTLFAVSEQYPDLKANTNFLELQRELSDTEDKIQAAYRFYNGVVRDYNTAVETAPNNMIAFELETPSDREVPQVSFESK